MAVIIEALQHRGVRLVALGWSAFIAENVIVTQNRDVIIGWLGSEQRYSTCYGTMSTACLAGTFWAYIKVGRHAGPAMFASTLPSSGRVAAAFVLQGLGLVGFSQMMPPLLPADRGAALPMELAQAAGPSPANQSAPTPGSVAAVVPAESQQAGSGSGCPVPRWLRGNRPKPADHPVPITSPAEASSSSSSSSTAPAEASSKAAAELPASSGGGGGCPVPRWLRGGRPKPADHPPTPVPVPLEAAAAADKASVAPDKSAAPAPSSGSGCPVPRWMRGGRPKPADHPEPPAQAVAVPAEKSVQCLAG
eukprot:TRINITY_DN19746_c0_g1_i2.p1 TRINITY_DN19746_c0_g1~~TRINITY_DN19746_c0_g1_i2.p1  ORF type:complete len:324 (+),score=63.97 TRINITY_DN19746_c0_g1_i2:57-974(+)